MNAPMTKAEAIAAGNVPALVKALRKELAKGKDNIPAELKALKGWLVWKVTDITPTTGKFNKIPIYPRSGANRHGEQGSDTDRANLGTWDDARNAMNTDKTLAGVGLAMLAPFGIVALDADKCVTYGELREDVAAITNGTYCELSPSGTGVRAFWTGIADDGKNHDSGFELFHSAGFVTITGQQVDNVHSICDDKLPCLLGEERTKLEALSRSTGKRGKGVARSDKLKQAAEDDPVLNAIKDAGLFERDMGGGQFSIECPFEHEHSDFGRAGGDGDTCYFLPNTNGYAQGHFQCLHSHCKGRTDAEYLDAIGYSHSAAAIADLMADFGEVDESGWPDPIPLPDDLPPVPAFNLDLLPEALRPWVADIAERMQISPDIPAIGAVTALSAAIGRRVQIRPKVHDDWTVIPNLWGMVVAPPGYMKSPALTQVMGPLHKLERDANHEHDNAMAAWAMEKERIAIANSAAKSVALGKLKKDPTAEIGGVMAEPDEPIARRYVVNNFSLEALGEVLMGNPDGVLAFNDELYGLLKMADKPGNEELHAFLLTAWNGDSGFNFDRIGRGRRYLDYVCVAVLGGIQPGRLIDYITESGAGDSGFVQRFQLLTWPDLPDDWVLIDRTPDKAAQEAAYRVFERAAGRDPIRAFFEDGEAIDGPDVRQFDSEAQAAFFAWLESNERLVRGDTLPDVMRAHLSKFKSLVPSLAVIFAVADDVKGAIPLRYVRQAIGWAEYLRPHAERAFACTTRPDTRHARALLTKIKQGDVPDEFRPADVYWKGWAMLDREGLGKATALLCDLGYLLRQEKRPEGKHGGRPSTTYRINPKAKG